MAPIRREPGTVPDPDPDPDPDPATVTVAVAQHITSDEARAFLEAAHNVEDPLYAAYVLVLVLGLRRGEVFTTRSG